ncbi:MAG: hypothetical protein WCL44_05825 [bacterium]
MARPKVNKPAWIAFAGVILAAVIAGLFGLFKHIPTSNQSAVTGTGEATANTVGENISVTSHNQSGGITAGKIIVGRQPRKLDPQFKAQLERLLTHDTNQVILVDAQLGDQEAVQFAEEIKTYLESCGRKVNGVREVVGPQHLKGQMVTPDGKTITIGSMDRDL